VEIVRVFHAAPSAPTQARRSLDALRSMVSLEQLDDVRLVVSELVTNSVLHAGLSGEDAVTLAVEVLPDRIRIEVTDRGHGFTDQPEDIAEGHGHGLIIVEQLADRWGTDRGSETKVWAEFALRS
jgi:anti-sigma regulatory factor (Ser/Thr protein kinase)